MLLRKYTRREFIFQVAVSAACISFLSLSCSQDHVKNLGVLDVHRMNPQTYFADEYSFLTPPYSFYYKHNMYELDLRFDWIFAGDNPVHLNDNFANQLPTLNYETRYSFRGQQYTIKEYLKRTDALGLLVLKGNRIVFEEYFHGANRKSRFDTCSIEKTFVSCLIGIALQEGKIQDINDEVVKYLPYLSNSGFDGTTIKNLLQMTSNVDWEGDWENSNLEMHDFGVFFPALLEGAPSFKELAKSTIRGPVAPGSKFAYQNTNTIVLGLILEKVYGAQLNHIIETKLWKPAGMETDAFVWCGKKQPDFQACGGLNATLRDYARFGRIIANNGLVNGQQVVPQSWIKEIYEPDLDFLKPKPPGPNDLVYTNFGYNNKWWLCYGDGKNHPIYALGAFGQMIYVDSQHDFVAVQTSAQEKGEMGILWDEMLTVFATLAQRIL
ncbi:serine hydrolase domain-containing protein [Planctomycetota bacterium]